MGALLLLLVFGSFADDTYYATDYLPSASAAGAAGSSALHMSSNAIVAWANSYTNMQYGTDVDEAWMTPEKALGPAEGTSYEIVSLGRGGQITLTFSNGIGNRPGADFTVFENGISDTFLELAWVEVSSDGINFVRFPNYSDTPSAIGAFGELYTGWIYGLAGKYRQGYGTPFDLDELRMAYNAQLAGNTDFSSAFATALTNGFPLLDLANITHVRLIDIIGDGSSALDAGGTGIYDPYATIISAGFDLDAVGILNESFIPYTDWAAIQILEPLCRFQPLGLRVMEWTLLLWNMPSVATHPAPSGSRCRIIFQAGRMPFQSPPNNGATPTLFIEKCFFPPMRQNASSGCFSMENKTVSLLARGSWQWRCGQGRRDRA